MPFEKGNKLGGDSGLKLFDGALRRAIAQDSSKRLRDAAEQLLTLASQGEAWALQMLADRLDGKPGQSVAIQHTHRKVTDYTDEQLTAIAFGSGAGNAAAAKGEGKSPGVH